VLLSVWPHWPIQTVLTYTDDARRHFSSATHPIKARLSVLRPPHNDERSAGRGLVSPGRIFRVDELPSDGVDSEVDADGSGHSARVAIRPCRPVPGGAVGGLHHDLAGALELRGHLGAEGTRPSRSRGRWPDPAPWQPRSSSAPTGCRPPARPGQSRSGHRRGPARGAGGSSPTVRLRSAWSA
jgi:hypothetical protein